MRNESSRWRVVFTPVLLLSLPAATSVAQVTPPRDTAQLEDVVVSATRVPIPIASSFATVSVIDSEMIRATGAVFVSDVLRQVPGLTVVQSGSRGAITSMFMRGGESDFVLVLIDGVPANVPGGRFDLASLTTHAVERIEIVRGPASVLYGSDAVSGVVHVITKDGEGPSEASLSVRGGYYGTVDVGAAIQGSSRRAGWSLAGGRYGTDGVLAFNNDYRNDEVSGAVSFSGARGSNVRLSGRHRESAYHFPTDFTGAVVDSNAYRNERASVASLGASAPLTARVQGRVELGAARVAAVNDDSPDSPGDTEGFYYRNNGVSTRYRGDAALDFHLAELLVLTFGGASELQTENTTGYSQFGTFDPVDDPPLDARRHSAATYAQLLGSARQLLSYTVGLRYDRGSAFGDFVTYRAGTAVRIGASTRARISVGTAFKEPTFFENFAQSPFARGNPDLRPERSRVLEIGLEHAVASRLSARVTAFRQKFSDLIQYTSSTPSPDDPSYVNVASALAQGAELELGTPLPLNASLSLSYTWLDTEVLDPGTDTGPAAVFARGEPLIRRPRHSAGAMLSYVVGDCGRLSAQANYVGSRSDIDFSSFPAERVQLDSYVRVDVSGSWCVVAPGRRPGLTLLARVENLIGERYEDVRNFPVPGRILLAGVRIDFAP